MKTMMELCRMAVVVVVMAAGLYLTLSEADTAAPIILGKAAGLALLYGAVKLEGYWSKRGQLTLLDSLTQHEEI